MSTSSFVELLRKSNLDFLMTRKPLKIGSHSEDIILASLINFKTKNLQLIACLDKSESVTIWSTSLDERVFQLNARLLDLTELSETLNFLAERIKESDFTITKANDNSQDIPQLNVTFIHSKNKQSITIQLNEVLDEGEKALFLSKLFFHIYKNNEQLRVDVKTQQIFINQLSTKTQNVDGEKVIPSTDTKTTTLNNRRSLINPTSKRRKVATGINYDDDDSD